MNLVPQVASFVLTIFVFGPTYWIGNVPLCLNNNNSSNKFRAFHQQWIYVFYNNSVKKKKTQ